MGPGERSWLPLVGVLAAAAVVLALPVLFGAVSFVSSDEMRDYYATRAQRLAQDEPPQQDVARAAFVPYGTDTDLSRALTPTFSAVFSVPAMAGLPGVLAATIAFSVLAVACLHLVVRDMLRDEPAALVSGVLLTLSPPLLFFGGIFFENVPVLALFALSLLLLARAVQTDGLGWLVASAAVLLLAVSFRRDALPYFIPLAVVLAAKAWTRPRLWVLFAAFAYAAFVSVRIGVLHESPFTAWIPSAQAFGDVGGQLARTQGRYGAGDWSVLGPNADAYAFALYPVLAVAGAVGLLLVRYRTPGHARVAAGAFAAVLLVCLVAFTIHVGHQDPPGLFSSIVRYTLVLPLLLALGAGALVATLARPLPRGARMAWAVLAVACIAAPGVVSATVSEPGLVWLAKERAAHAAFVAETDLLPPGAYLVGDEPSKFVPNRPVLVPGQVLAPESRVPLIIDQLDAQNLSGYVHRTTYYRDWTGPAGDFLVDDHHYVTPSGIGDFFAIRRTNTSLANVGVLGKDHWAATEDGLLRSAAAHSYFSPPPSLAARLGAGRVAVAIELTILDERDGLHRAGYVNSPGGPNDVVPGVSWQGGATGLWRTETFLVPAGAVVNGPFFLSEGLTVRDLRILPLSGVVVG